MTAITVSATSTPVAFADPSTPVEDRSQQAPSIDLRAAFQTELSGVVDRLVAAATTTTDAALVSAAVASQQALDTVLADLADKTRQNETLTESFLQLEIHVEE